MKPKWIRVTGYLDGSEMIIKVEKIRGIYRNTQMNRTEIAYKNGDKYFVRQSVEEVIEKISPGKLDVAD